jgi:hypothetical protein
MNSMQLESGIHRQLVAGLWPHPSGWVSARRKGGMVRECDGRQARQGPGGGCGVDAMTRDATLDGRGGFNGPDR